MVIIATNNGKNYLNNLLVSFDIFNIKKIIHIVDTGSTDIESIQFLEDLKTKKVFKNLNIITHNLDYKCFDSGAYIYALNNIDSEKYYFLHDSITIKTSHFFDKIDEKLKSGTIVPLVGFSSNLYDNQEQIDFSINKIGSSEFDIGIFGPMFAITKEDVYKIKETLNFFPTNKNEQMAMERVWSVVFKKYNILVDPLEGFYDHYKILNNGYEYFNKILVYRN